MHRSPEFIDRVWGHCLRLEWMRALVSLLLLALLILASSPIWIALMVPIVTYAALSMMTLTPGTKKHVSVVRSSSPASYESFAMCTSKGARIQSYASEIGDEALAAQLRHIGSRIDESVKVIYEDGKQDAAGRLLDLVETTDELIAAYLKVVRRGFDCDELRERLQDNLATLDAAYEQFWVRLNRDTVIHLSTLNDVIDLSILGHATPGRISGTA